ncbi:MAG: transglutaminase-like domain-containing protein [Spirochaetaceae bacterium]
MKRIARRTLLTGAPLLLTLAALAAFPAVSLPPVVESFLDGVNPAALAVAGVAAAWTGLLLTPGHKRLPFFVTAALGGLTVLWTVGAPVLGVSAAALELHDGIGVLAGLVLLVAARVVSTLTRLNTRRFLVALAAAVSAVVLVLPQVPGVAALEEKPLTYQGELNVLLSLLEGSGGEYEEEIEPYIEEIARDKELEWEEQRDRVKELKERISELESERERFEETREQNAEYREEIARLRRRVDEVTLRAPEADDLEKVTSYREAVRPSVPLVRDFAVELAGEAPGPYHRSSAMRMPGAIGIRQVVAVHRYASAQWKYVNDPVVARTDYYSPADRTIAAGLAGDCDDFAVLLASAVEAIGGRARIMHGRCESGAHAWAEAYVGDRSAWAEARKVLAQAYPGRRIEYITPRDVNDYWLSLDWEVGTYSCGEQATVEYVSP